jgi:hypothetical protein
MFALVFFLCLFFAMATWIGWEQASTAVLLVALLVAAVGPLFLPEGHCGQNRLLI